MQSDDPKTEAQSDHQLRSFRLNSTPTSHLGQNNPSDQENSSSLQLDPNTIIRTNSKTRTNIPAGEPGSTQASGMQDRAKDFHEFLTRPPENPGYTAKRISKLDGSVTS